MTLNLTREAAYANKTPYEIWQEQEGIPIVRGHCVEDLTAVPVAPWSRKGVEGGFINLIGAGRTCERPYRAVPRGHLSQRTQARAGAHILILSGEGYSYFWQEGKQRIRINWRPGSLLEPPADWFHQHFNPGREPARYLALKPWGFTYQVEDLSKTDQDIKSGGTQIEYKDQDPEIHATFLAECQKRGTEVLITC